MKKGQQMGEYILSKAQDWLLPLLSGVVITGIGFFMTETRHAITAAQLTEALKPLSAQITAQGAQISKQNEQIALVREGVANIKGRMSQQIKEQP
jgi:uncharacterized coiled-coil protein SlyX